MDSIVYKLPQATSKECKECGSLHSFHDFTVDNSKKDGLSLYRRNCLKKKNRRNKARPEAKIKRRGNAYKYKEYNRNYSLKARYRITKQQYDALFLSQNFQCAVCQTKTSSGPGNGFVVDHCHKTGKIRGILCNLFNVALGSMKEDVEILRRMTEYLEKGK